ncbi:GntR family transcriptional regulator [Halobacillus mangrovi]|uniref:GntR family transcriptional regulator n=1 Tax=Halobacillus mangrovi TaxID=402384 RepID=A0A1W5ZYU8_9BACI|nr:GntR family transcriptional regulator [Halobacillus mangrovi]ARI78526.1 GntR family transcriptional regulator [Halobacillus mangrovi]
MSTKKRNEEMAYEKVKRAIMLKRLNPGQRITEDWVSKELNMSRTPIRAAFKRLENEKLIELVPNRGAVVHNPSNKELEDVFNLRTVLETYAAGLAIPKLTNKDLEVLKDLLEQEEAAYRKKDFEEFMRVNGLIHAYPAKVADNKFLLHEIETLNQWSDCYLILRDEFYSTPIDEVKSIPEHKEIVLKLEERDTSGVEAAIRSHMSSTLKDLSLRTSIFN